MPLSEKPAPADYPPSRMVIIGGHTRWRAINGFLGRRGVAYRLPALAGAAPRSTLWIRPARQGELGAMPALPPFTTAGCCASAWQEEGLLYVLVVQGDVATYQGYLNLPREPIAFRDWKTAGKKGLVAWDEVAEVIGGSSQTGSTADNTSRHDANLKSDRSPTEETVCSTHPTVPGFPPERAMP